MSRIYFEPTTTGVACLIYSDEGALLATHEMTTAGAQVRRTDFDVAIDEAQWHEEMLAVVALVEQPIA